MIVLVIKLIYIFGIVIYFEYFGIEVLLLNGFIFMNFFILMENC